MQWAERPKRKSMRPVAMLKAMRRSCLRTVSHGNRRPHTRTHREWWRWWGGGGRVGGASRVYVRYEDQDPLRLCATNLLPYCIVLTTLSLPVVPSSTRAARWGEGGVSGGGGSGGGGGGVDQWRITRPTSAKADSRACRRNGKCVCV